MRIKKYFFHSRGDKKLRKAFYGEVLGQTSKGYYLVKYEDGDSEEMTMDEISKFLVADDQVVQVPSKPADEPVLPKKKSKKSKDKSKLFSPSFTFRKPKDMPMVTLDELRKITMPKKPEKNRSSYIFFVEKNKLQFEEENPSSENKAKPDYTAWRELTGEQRKEFDTLAANDLMRFQNEEKEYKAEVERLLQHEPAAWYLHAYPSLAQNMTLEALAGPKTFKMYSVKRPKPAWKHYQAAYIEEEAAKGRTRNFENYNTFHKEAAAKWKELSEEEKQPFIALYNEERKDALRELQEAILFEVQHREDDPSLSAECAAISPTLDSETKTSTKNNTDRKRKSTCSESVLERANQKGAFWEFRETLRGQKNYKKIAEERWKNLASEEKQIYTEKAEKNRARHLKRARRIELYKYQSKKAMAEKTTSNAWYTTLMEEMGKKLTQPKVGTKKTQPGPANQLVDLVSDSENDQNSSGDEDVGWKKSRKRSRTTHEKTTSAASLAWGAFQKEYRQNEFQQLEGKATREMLRQCSIEAAAKWRGMSASEKAHYQELALKEHGISEVGNDGMVVQTKPFDVKVNSSKSMTSEAVRQSQLEFIDYFCETEKISRSEAKKLWSSMSLHQQMPFFKIYSVNHRCARHLVEDAFQEQIANHSYKSAFELFVEELQGESFSKKKQNQHQGVSANEPLPSQQNSGIKEESEVELMVELDTLEITVLPNKDNELMVELDTLEISANTRKADEGKFEACEPLQDIVEKKSENEESCDDNDTQISADVHQHEIPCKSIAEQENDNREKTPDKMERPKNETEKSCEKEEKMETQECSSVVIEGTSAPEQQPENEKACEMMETRRCIKETQHAQNNNPCEGVEMDESGTTEQTSGITKLSIVTTTEEKTQGEQKTVNRALCYEVALKGSTQTEHKAENKEFGKGIDEQEGKKGGNERPCKTTESQEFAEYKKGTDIKKPGEVAEINKEHNKGTARKGKLKIPQRSWRDGMTPSEKWCCMTIAEKEPYFQMQKDHASDFFFQKQKELKQQRNMLKRVKLPKTAFIHFLEEMRSSLPEDGSLQELVMQAGSVWNDLSEKKKQIYKEKAEKEKLWLKQSILTCKTKYASINDSWDMLISKLSSLPVPTASSKANAVNRSPSKHKQCVSLQSKANPLSSRVPDLQTLASSIKSSCAFDFFSREAMENMRQLQKAPGFDQELFNQLLKEKWDKMTPAEKDFYYKKEPDLLVTQLSGKKLVPILPSKLTMAQILPKPLQPSLPDKNIKESSAQGVQTPTKETPTRGWYIKAPKSAYQYFIRDLRMSQRSPGVKLQDINGFVEAFGQQMWKDLSDKDKEPYIEQEKKDISRYYLEKKFKDMRAQKGALSVKRKQEFDDQEDLLKKAEGTMEQDEKWNEATRNSILPQPSSQKKTDASIRRQKKQKATHNAAQKTESPKPKDSKVKTSEAETQPYILFDI